MGCLQGGVRHLFIQPSALFPSLDRFLFPRKKGRKGNHACDVHAQEEDLLAPFLAFAGTGRRDRKKGRKGNQLGPEEGRRGERGTMHAMLTPRRRISSPPFFPSSIAPIQRACFFDRLF